MRISVKEAAAPVKLNSTKYEHDMEILQEAAKPLAEALRTLGYKLVADIDGAFCVTAMPEDIRPDSHSEATELLESSLPLFPAHVDINLWG